MKYNIEAHQNANGKWKVNVKADIPYFQYLELKKQVIETMEEHGFPIQKLVGVDQ